MKISIIGTGYVGLVTGACLADAGNEVWCSDKNEEKIRKLSDGIIPIYEPGLDSLVKRGITEERLFFTTALAPAMEKADICFLTVDTPSNHDGTTDLTNVFAAAEALSAALEPSTLVVTKSTVPVGTTLKIKERLKKKWEVPVASNPEFLKEGTSVQDFSHPDRIVVGVERPEDAEVLRELYAPFMRKRERFLVMDIPSAELTKYVANAMLACRISFMNEMANLCERAGADIDKVREALGWDHRVGPHFLFPGLGYGGSCLPKDVAALLQLGADKDYPLSLLQAVDTVNKKQRKIFFEKIIGHFGSSKNLRGKRIAFWGISFKPETDDVREAPALYLMEKLSEGGAMIRAFDPVAGPKARETPIGKKVEWVSNNYACLEEADALVICTEWNEFRSPDFEKMKRRMRRPVIFDGRNLYNPQKLKASGFFYASFGRNEQQG
ncbi:MAG: UDP-glucose/GDP-mannose dehydrogenase family protein [Deltaproteobacteria bacterium]|nr:UDP-glucose/GDP-mannose dehydrogenase family protein [Deltaproteobacteria bacterium]MBI4224565.1 UDP-glucose/GDP-mannose dehydrogenase family protein [Deltaproteobacteria bacterium]